jgi:hypothetical protein
MRPSLTVVAWLAVAAGLTAGCASPAPPPLSTSTVASPSPTPEVRFELSRSTIRNDPPMAMGFLTLEAGPDSSELLLDVAVIGANGDVAHRGETRTLTPLLRSSEAFFALEIPAGLAAPSLEVALLSRQPASRTLQALEATILSSTWLGGRVQSFLGRLETEGVEAVTPAFAIVIGVDEERDPMTFAGIDLVVDRIRPREAVPFRVDVAQADGIADWEIYAFGQPSAGAPERRVSLDGEINLLDDPQGHRYAVGALTNPTNRPRWVRVGVLLKTAESWRSLGMFETPSLLPPNAAMPFAIDAFPGLDSDDPDDPDLDVVPYIVEAEATAAVHEMQPELTAFEVVGSRLYLRGVIRNTGSIALDDATIVAGVHDDAGNLLTAGWSAAEQTSMPGDEVSFLLVLPVPRRTDLSLAEYDVRAFGLEW